MDPNAALKSLLEAVELGIHELSIAEGLLSWLHHGGFQPDLSKLEPEQQRRLILWAVRYAIEICEYAIELCEGD